MLKRKLMGLGLCVYMVATTSTPELDYFEYSIFQSSGT